MNITLSVSDKNIGFTLNYGCIYRVSDLYFFSPNPDASDGIIFLLQVCF